MTHKIKRLAILILGLWLVTAGLRDQLAEAAAGSNFARLQQAHQQAHQQSLQKRLGQPQRGGSYGYSKPAAPAPGGYTKPAAPLPAVIPSRPPARPPPAVIPNRRPPVPAVIPSRPPARPVPAPPPTPNLMESSLRQLREGMPNRGKARLRQLIPPRPPGPRTPKPAPPSAPNSTRSWSKGCKGRELPSP